MIKQSKMQFINSIEEALQMTLLGLKYLKEKYDVKIFAKPTRSPLSKPDRLPLHLQYHVTLTNITEISLKQQFQVRKALAINNIGFDTGYGFGEYDWELDWSFIWSKSDGSNDEVTLKLLENEYNDDMNDILDFILYYNKNKDETLESLKTEIYGTTTNIL